MPNTNVDLIKLLFALFISVPVAVTSPWWPPFHTQPSLGISVVILVMAPCRTSQQASCFALMNGSPFLDFSAGVCIELGTA